MPTVSKRSRRIRALTATVAAFAMLAGPAATFAAGPAAAAGPKGDVSGIVLRPKAGFSVSGTVLLPNGRALRSATVSLVMSGLPTGLESDTDGKGRYRLENVPAGRYAVRVEPHGGTAAPGWFADTAPGHVATTAAKAAPIFVGASLGLPTMRLHGGARLTGRLANTAATSAPLVMLVPDDQPSIRDGLGPFADVDPSGRFVFDGLAPGSYHLVVYGAVFESGAAWDCVGGGYYAAGTVGRLSGLTAEASVIRVGTSAITLPPMSFPSTVTVSGTLTDTGGAPVEQAQVEIISDALMADLASIPDETGRAVRTTAPRTPKEVEKLALTRRDQLGQLLARRLVEPSAALGFLAAAIPASTISGCSTTTNGTGAWTIGAAPADLYAVRAAPDPKSGYAAGWYDPTAPGHSTEIDALAGRLVVSEGTPPVDMMLETGGTLVGRIVDSSGGGVNAQVAIAGPTEINVDTDSSGMFRLDSLPAGEYTAVIYSLGAYSYSQKGSESGWYAAGAKGNFSLTEADATRLTIGPGVSRIRVQLPDGYAISGKVVLPGAPETSNDIQAVALDGSVATETFLGMNGPPGTFTLVGLNPGSYRVYLSTPLGERRWYGGWYTKSGSTHITADPDKATVVTVGP